MSAVSGISASVDGSKNSMLTNSASVINSGTDEVSRSIQVSIDKLNQKSDEIKQQEDLSDDEKKEQQKQIDEQITQLKQQLQQHLQDVKRQEQEKQNELQQEQLEDSQKAVSKKVDGAELSISKAGMEAFTQASQSIKESSVLKKVATASEGKAAVTKSEIAADAERGVDTSDKTSELNAANSTTDTARSKQISSLEKAGKKLQTSIEEDSENSTSSTSDKTTIHKKTFNYSAQSNVHVILDNNTNQNAHEKRESDKELDSVNITIESLL